MNNREEAIKYGTEWLKDEYLDARDGAFIEIALEALKQEPCRDIEEIKEIMECDADAEIKLKMISNVVYSKPHYFRETTDDNWLYETGREEPEILGSGSTYYNVVRTKDENEAMKLSKEAARTYLRRTQTKNGVTITQEYSCQEGWINV